MPDILDPKIVAFDGSYARPVAEEIVKAYDTMKHYHVTEWPRLLGQTTVPNTTDQVADGSQSSLGNAADGRGPLTGQVLTGLDVVINLLIAALEANATIGSTTKPRVEFMRDVAVNRAPRF